MYARSFIPDYALVDANADVADDIGEWMVLPLLSDYAPWVIACSNPLALSDEVLGSLWKDYKAAHDPGPDLVDGFYDRLGTLGYTIFSNHPDGLLVLNTQDGDDDEQ